VAFRVSKSKILISPLQHDVAKHFSLFVVGITVKKIKPAL